MTLVSCPAPSAATMPPQRCLRATYVCLFVFASQLRSAVGNYALPPRTDPTAHAIFLHSASLASLGASGVSRTTRHGYLLDHFMKKNNGTEHRPDFPFFRLPEAKSDGAGGPETISPPPDFGEVDHVGVLTSLHAAAVGGDMEAQMAMGYRYSKGYGVQKSCNIALQYYEEAANNAMDMMENSELRGRVIPSVSRHRLSEIHTAGSIHHLSGHNKPHEQSDALDFFRHNVLAHKDVKSALTLAQMHYAGIRGVEQSMRLSLEYYAFAADRGDRMAAGMAGTMLLLGMGTERDDEKAYKYLMQGAKKGADCDNECDPTSLNGQGLMALTGMPHLKKPVQRDLPYAMRCFEKAKNYGSFDAVYHIGMLRMGWMKELEGVDDDIPTDLKDNNFEKVHQDLQNLMDQDKAIGDLTKAAKGGYLPSIHRLAIVKAHGIGTSRNCGQAVDLFQQMAELGPLAAHRMREGYRHYQAGRREESLAHYLVAAETGVELAQSNAAFLLEQGSCLGLDEQACASASLRLWKAAAKQGNAEAYMKVGDFHYYGKLNKGNGSVRFDVLSEVRRTMKVGVRELDRIVRRQIGMQERQNRRESTADENTCDAAVEEEGGTCPARPNTPEEQLVLENYDNAAMYYRKAADQNIPHAMFNLGYMYEWGIGVKQDFPLAKRHYDLAAAANPDANIPVQIALVVMKVHERALKLWRQRKEEDDVAAALEEEKEGGAQENHGRRKRPGFLRVIVKHVMSLDSLCILSLLLFLFFFIRHRGEQLR